jgi:hypothetical protein
MRSLISHFGPSLHLCGWVVTFFIIDNVWTFWSIIISLCTLLIISVLKLLWKSETNNKANQKAAREIMNKHKQRKGVSDEK